MPAALTAPAELAEQLPGLLEHRRTPFAAQRGNIGNHERIVVNRSVERDNLVGVVLERLELKVGRDDPQPVLVQQPAHLVDGAAVRADGLNRSVARRGDLRKLFVEAVGQPVQAVELHRDRQ
jgi:hypothetical protein